jgi:hypothetical protein
MKPKDLVVIHRFGFCDFDDKFYGSIGEILPFDKHICFFKVKGLIVVMIGIITKRMK